MGELRNNAELLHHPERVPVRVLLDDLAVRKARKSESRDLHLLAGGRDAHQVTVVLAATCPAGRDLVALGDLLVDTETPSRLAYEELYLEHGHELPLDKWATLVGTIGAPFDPDEHLEELVGRPLDRKRMSQRLRAREHELCDLEDLRPGIEDYLAEAERRHLATGIVSSSTREWISRHLKRLDRLDGWEVIMAADGDPERAKPRPTLYLDALDALDLGAGEAIAFEDSLNGVRAAKDRKSVV